MILTRILRGVNHLNTNFLAHRDLKPVLIFTCMHVSLLYLGWTMCSSLCRCVYLRVYVSHDAQVFICHWIPSL